MGCYKCKGWGETESCISRLPCNCTCHLVCACFYCTTVQMLNRNQNLCATATTTTSNNLRTSACSMRSRSSTSRSSSFTSTLRPMSLNAPIVIPNRSDSIGFGMFSLRRPSTLKSPSSPIHSHHASTFLQQQPIAKSPSSTTTTTTTTNIRRRASQYIKSKKSSLRLSSMSRPQSMLFAPDTTFSLSCPSSPPLSPRLADVVVSTPSSIHYVPNSPTLSVSSNGSIATTIATATNNKLNTTATATATTVSSCFSHRHRVNSFTTPSNNNITTHNGFLPLGVAMKHKHSVISQSTIFESPEPQPTDTTRSCSSNSTTTKHYSPCLDKTPYTTLSHEAINTIKPPVKSNDRNNNNNTSFRQKIGYRLSRFFSIKSLSKEPRVSSTISSSPLSAAVY